VWGYVVASEASSWASILTWYPRGELIEYVHDEQIRKYGGRMGFHRDSKILDRIIAGTREYEGDICEKAAFLLRRLIVDHVFRDGQHRTAFVVAVDFLKKNNGSIYHGDYQKARSFFKEYRAYDVEQVARWIRYGDL